MQFPIDVGIDLDGCLYPFADVMRAWAAGARGEALEAPTTLSFWSDDWGMSDAEFDRLRTLGSSMRVVYDAGVPDPEVLAAMRRIADAGHRLHVISSRSGVWHVDEQVTRDWLWRWGVPHETLHIVDGSKAAVVGALGVRVMLEDSVVAARELHGVCNVAVWARAWNTQWDGVRIVSGWELEQLVEDESRRLTPRGAGLWQ
jgi:hypothetical protein